MGIKVEVNQKLEVFTVGLRAILNLAYSSAVCFHGKEGHHE